MTIHNHPTSQVTRRAALDAARERWHQYSQTVLVNGVEPDTPFYDSELRQLWVGRTVVKRFTQASDAQEIILAVFEEENWPRSIDDPLPVKDDQESKQRLRMAVCNLNRRQLVPLLRFQVIQRGTGVAWQFREDSTAHN